MRKLRGQRTTSTPRRRSPPSSKISSATLPEGSQLMPSYCTGPEAKRSLMDYAMRNGRDEIKFIVGEYPARTFAN